MAKPQLVRGTRDFGPKEMLRRQFLFQTLQTTFARFGFEPLETPALERLETLTGKYGDEGEGLLFKVLNNGDFWAKVPANQTLESKALLPKISERGLRYDLTVPFARYLSMNRHALALPFKRYQMQAVWRGDNPQHGRYREFYQCDVDVAGSKSLLYEAELLQIYDQCFAQLGLKVVLRLNHRKILEALAERLGLSQELSALTVWIDKLDKIGHQGLAKGLEESFGLSTQSIELLFEALEQKDLAGLGSVLGSSPSFEQAKADLSRVDDFLKSYAWQNRLVLDFSLARGLNYYTGCIFEVVVDTEALGQEGVKMGSIGGGGRYDNLTGVFGLADVSGVGISFGADRIYDVLQQLGKFEQLGQTQTKLLLLSLDEASLLWAFEQGQRLREQGLNLSIYPEVHKFKKQMDYANKLGVSFVGIIGETERLAGQIALKNMQTGEQTTCGLEGLVEILRKTP